MAGFEWCSRNKSALSVKSAREKIEILADWADLADFKNCNKNKSVLTLWDKLKILADWADYADFKIA